MATPRLAAVEAIAARIYQYDLEDDAITPKLPPSKITSSHLNNVAFSLCSSTGLVVILRK